RRGRVRRDDERYGVEIGAVVGDAGGEVGDREARGGRDVEGVALRIDLEQVGLPAGHGQRRVRRAVDDVGGGGRRADGEVADLAADLTTRVRAAVDVRVRQAAEDEVDLRLGQHRRSAGGSGRRGGERERKDHGLRRRVEHAGGPRVDVRVGGRRREARERTAGGHLARDVVDGHVTRPRAGAAGGRVFLRAAHLRVEVVDLGDGRTRREQSGCGKCNGNDL